MGNNSFTVLPMTQRFSLEPGKTYEGSITVVNPADSTEDFSYKASITPYGVVDKEYASGEDYESDLATTTNRTQITKWIEILEPTGTIKPNESKEVKFTITVPEGAPGGGQYATIAISSNNDVVEDKDVAINNIFEMASVIYASVNGETSRGGEIIENSVPGFSLSSALTTKAVISNTGNTHQDALVTISISNFFTGQVILPTEENDGEYNELIMPETTRNITRQINNLPSLGVVKINQTITYNGNVSTVEKNVIICPIWFMILVILTIIAIITTIVMIVKKHHRIKL